MVSELARKHEVHWLIRDTHAPVIGGFPSVACRLIGCAPGNNHQKPFADELVTMLRRERYDTFVDCSHWACIGWLAKQLHEIPVRATTDDPLQDSLLAVDRGPLGLTPYTHVVPVPNNGSGALVHQVTKWRRLFRDACGTEVGIDWTLPEWPVPLPGETLRVFLHPHASKNEKIWPTARFARVLAGAARKNKILCIVNAADKKILRTLKLRLLASRVRVVTSPLDPSFTELRRAIGKCHLAIGCDSGPMHYASLLGAPTLVVYSKYPAAEFGPLWRSTAVEPPPGLGAEAVSTDAVANALDSLIGALRGPEANG